MSRDEQACGGTYFAAASESIFPQTPLHSHVGQPSADRDDQNRYASTSSYYPPNYAISPRLPYAPPLSDSTLLDFDGAEERAQHARLNNARMPKRPKPRQPAPEGVIVTDKSCVRCRVRKVRCNRVFPKCDHCTARNEDCDLKDWRPKPKVKATDPTRVAELEQRLAELELQLAQSQGGSEVGGIPASAFDFPPDITAFKPITVLASAPGRDPAPTTTAVAPAAIGLRSLDWRLAQPQMASSLSRHLCEAFWESCCFLLPTYEFFRPRMSEFLPGRNDQLSAAQKIALTTFCAVGARTSPHSAVLGISLKPEDTVEHPNAPLLSAGTRRENACTALFEKAHRENYASGATDMATVENLATLMALLQLSLFAEPHPSRSKSLLRSAVSHYRELQDEADTEEQRAWIRTTFGFAIYTVDCLISMLTRRQCHIRDEDLRTYFARETRIIVPRLPNDNLLPVVEKVFKTIPSQEAALKTAKHLLACWVCACQRAFVEIVAPNMGPRKTSAEKVTGIRQLWMAIDTTHAAAQVMLGFAPPSAAHTHSHSRAPQNPGDPPEALHSVHAHDYGAQIVRLDRDLLDLVSLVHTHLAGEAARDLPPDLLRESNSRVRKALKRRAVYLKSYVNGADVHMTFHELMQLDLLPDWTAMVLERVGEPDGPQNADEEVTETELSWFIEGLQHACYYHPAAEKRLLELAPRFSAQEVRLDRSPRHPIVGSLTSFSAALISPSFPAWSDSALPPPPTPPNPLFTAVPSPPTAPLGFSPSLAPDIYASASALPSPPLDFDPWSPHQYGRAELDGLSFLEQLGPETASFPGWTTGMGGTA